jgi:TDG/mug DNA glycosylase family protein
MTGPFPKTPDNPSGLFPLAGPEPRILVLGSFPSVLSLAHNEYYGNPRNRFWAVMEVLFQIPAALPYAERCRRLTGEKVALWDVVAACSRPGSADSRIRDPVPNDIAAFIRANPSVRLITLNGSTAGRLYHRLAEVPGIHSVTLPSTSPAHAALTFEAKVKKWSIVKEASGG